MSNFMKDMFIEVREKKDPLTQLQALTEMVEEIVGLPIEALSAVHPSIETLTEAEGGFSVHLSLPRLTPNESWGDPNSQSRKDIDRIFASITRQSSIQARIAHVNSFVDPKLAKKKGTGMRFNAILNMMMIIEALQSCLNDYSESSSGFVFEGFMAAVTGGKQISGRVGGTLPIEDFVTGDDEAVSLKLLSPNTGIHGSFTNLVDYLFIRGGSGVSSIKYLIARKNSDDGESVSQLSIFDFMITRDNFVDIMTSTPKNAGLLGKAGGAFEQHVSAWQDSPEWRLQMFEILKQCPGYTEGKGMFYKNLDQEGTFDGDSSAPASPEKKQKQYDLMTKQGLVVDIKNTAERDAAAGNEPDFGKWVARWKLQDEDEEALQKFQGIYDKLYADKAAEVQQVAESYFGSFHEREKRLMQEESALMEGSSKEAGSQWVITRTGMADLRTVADVEYYGELDLSDENIKACAEIYIEKLGEDLTTLLKTTEEFTNNIGKYFSADRRSTAMNANKQAQAEGQEVVDLLAKDEKEPVKEI